MKFLFIVQLLILTLRSGVMPQLSFCIIIKFWSRVELSQFMTFPEQGMGTKCNNHPTGNCWVWRQTHKDYFNETVAYLYRQQQSFRPRQAQKMSAQIYTTVYVRDLDVE